MTAPMQGNILILSGVRGDTRRYRTLHLYEQLCLAGFDCVLSHITDPHLLEYVSSAAVAILHRVAFDKNVEKTLAALRKRNALVLLDADDFLYDPAIMRWIDSPDFQDPIRADLYRREILRHRATLEKCDAVTVSTDYLAEMLAPFGKPVRVHRNAFNLEMLALSDQAAHQSSRAEDRVVIGYASGTRTHDRDFASIKPVLVRLMEQFSQVELWLMGAVDPDQQWGALQNRVRTFPLVPWRALPERLAQFDINLAPLVPDSPFNQAKSEIKYMEAALVRTPTVASATDAFSYAIRPGSNGFLAASADDWQNALSSLIQNPAAREAVGQAAYEDVLTRYSPWVRGQAMRDILSDLALTTGCPLLPLPAQNTAQESDLRSRRYFSLEDEEHPTMADLARYSARNRGIYTLFGQAWVYFRRKLAPVIPFKNTSAK